MEHLGRNVIVYPDAEELIQRRLFQEGMSKRMDEIRGKAAHHPLLTKLLKIPLLPYQLEGIAFAAGTGRAMLADDMGLGKTIQGVGMAELLAREAGIGKVLVVCPASLKSQWRNEIQRFCDRSVQLVTGGAEQRSGHYENDAFFTVCNYEQVLRDIFVIERVRWDLIILDEGQRIKNWQSKTARMIKALKSPLCPGSQRHAAGEPPGRIALRDAVRRRPPPASRPSASSTVIASLTRKAKCWATKTSTSSEALRGILLRRTRDRSCSNSRRGRRIGPHSRHRRAGRAAQRHMRIVAMITRKPYISEMDLLRLQKALLMCRMTANSTVLVESKSPAIPASWPIWRTVGRALRGSRPQGARRFRSGRRCST